MEISLSALKENPALYFEIAKTTDVIVTKRNKRIGRIVSEDSALRTDRRRAIDTLIGSVEFPAEYDDPDYDTSYGLIRDAAFKDKGLLT